MFSKIRNRLTMQYTVVMATFLLTFIVVSYSGILWLLYREEQQDIIAFTEEEAREQAQLLKHKDSKPLIKTNSENESKLFFYVYDNNGQLVSAELPVPMMRPGIENTIANWVTPDNVGKIKQIRLASGDKAVFIMCSTHIYDGQEVLGRIYVGEDITSYYGMLKMMLIFLAVSAILFIFGAAFIGHLLAGRAIIPIKQAFSRQREFAADASHELRTPLSILLTSAEAIKADDGNSLTSFSDQTLDDMKSEIRRMSRIVSDLLTLARADAGVANLVKENFNLHVVTEQIIRSVHPLADEKGITLELESHEDIAVYADRERISQLLLILIDNAIKYTSSGGNVKVLIKAVTDRKPDISITVIDTGIGIPQKDREIIFERFYRLDKARSREAGGTGLGLSIAKWIVEAHGGEIRVESSQGNGSTFTATIPIKSQ